MRCIKLSFSLGLFGSNINGPYCQDFSLTKQKAEKKWIIIKQCYVLYLILFKISCAFTCYCETACGSSLMNYASSIKRAQKYMTIKISSSAIALSNSVHIQDHLNPIYHQLQSILTVRTISQPYLTIKTKKSSRSIRHCHLGQAAC